jgi:peptidoglycan/xylan/chitin deacetylase (PgdA/CDA1 family)
MYHELALPERPLCHSEPGYKRYVVSASDFRSQIERLAGEGLRGKNVSEAIQSFGEKSVCITFDDGCETDLITAAPVLKELGFGATFYLTVDFLGKPGYLSHAQVRALSASGFEIGCHSQTHPYLTDIDESRIQDETAGARKRLEQIAGLPIQHFSCPGGRWDQRTVEAVKAAKFKTMATSRTGSNSARTDPFALTRVAVLDGTTPEAFLRTSRGQGLLRTQLQEKVRAAAKRMLGNSAYDSLRGMILGQKTSDSNHD